jgi:phosphatidate cytidylyltransferase
MSVASSRWADLRPRMISAGIMASVGAFEIWLGGPTFTALVVVLTAVMLWELARMTAIGPGHMPIDLAILGGISLVICLFSTRDAATALLLIPALAFALTPRRDRRLSAAWAAGAMVAGYGLVTLRNEAGTEAILWLVLVVVASDVMGYFAGRTLGGPKFWPAISPKKTWSGTIAGWVGAALVGLGFVLIGQGTWGLVVLSPFVAFAGQMGDVFESWIKRRTGVKDSSNLIPGHGGVLDRFDAMTGALVLLMILNLAISLPLPGAAGG